MTPSELAKYYLNSIAQIIGRMGYSNPPDAYSGVKIGENTYPVMLRNDGCYVYFDENGKRHNLNDVPKADYEFVNIKDARTAIENQCYRTPGGMVELRIHTYMNNEDDVLSMRVVVINSTDVDNPIGTEMDEIPATWVAVDCSIAEMTSRDIMYVDRCYATPGGKVNVVGMESIDPRLGMETAFYEVLRTTDDNIAVGTAYQSIPDSWSRIVCDFPDMTQREITPILKCYMTPGGKVQVEGYKVFDFEMTVRMEWYRIKQSTDPDNAVGSIIVGIPDDWEEMVCDFTDMEDRDIEVTTECYSTGNGKVKLEVLTSWDGNLGVRTKEYRVLETTDAAHPENTVMDTLPGNWVRIVCDFDDMEDRNIEVYVECYMSDNGAVKVERVVSYDSKIGERHVSYRVRNSDNPEYPTNTAFTSLPDGWRLVQCDFDNMEDRSIQSFVECYDNDGAPVKILHIVSFDPTIFVRHESFEVLDSRDDAYKVGDSMESIPDTWNLVLCDMEDMGDRLIDSVEECYSDGQGNIKVVHKTIYDPRMGKRVERFIVIDSIVDSVVVGSELDAVPDGFNRVVCDMEDMGDRLIERFEECYQTAGGKIKVDHVQVYDPRLGERDEKFIIVDSTDTRYNVGDEYDALPEGAPILCDMENMDDRLIHSAIECFATDGGKVKVNRVTVYDPRLGARVTRSTVVDTTDPAFDVGQDIDGVPDGDPVICDFDNMEDRIPFRYEECYRDADGSTNRVVRTVIMDVRQNIISRSYSVIDSTNDTKIGLGGEGDVPNGWTLVRCDIPDMTERHVVPVRGCYSTAAGAIFVDGWSVVDNNLDVKSYSLIVMESTDVNYTVGMKLTDFPEGSYRIECECKTCQDII